MRYQQSSEKQFHASARVFSLFGSVYRVEIQD